MSVRRRFMAFSASEHSKTRLRLAVGAACAAAVAALAAGCGGSGSSASSGGASGTAPAASAAASVKPIATVPKSELVRSGHLLACADFPAPPQELYNSNGTPDGTDVETGNAIGQLLGLKTEWVNSVFDTIIEALSAGKCDLIIAGMFITPERQKQIDFVPYLTSGQQFLVKKGNPQKISDDWHSLCGKTVSVELGDVEQYTTQAYSKKCEKAGKPSIKLLISSKVDVALEQVTTDKAATFFYDSPLVGYYAHTRPQELEAVQPAIGPLIIEGIGVTKNHKGLERAVRVALKRVEQNGTYKKILTKWGLQAVKVPPLQ